MKELLEKYLNGTATPEEIRAVEDWYNSLSGVDDSEALSEEERKRLKRYHWKRLSRQLALSRDGERWLSKVLRMAAVFAGIVMIMYFVLPDTDGLKLKRYSSHHHDSVHRQHVIENVTRKVRGIALIDGSTVSLYPGSVLTIDETFDEEERRVSLVGRAVFEVSRDASKPFYVETNEVVTKVLGTNFLVDAYPDASEINISVNSGAVSVYSSDTKGNARDEAAVILKPNQQAVYNKSDKSVSRTLVRNPRIVIPQEEVNRIRFEGVPVSEIFRALEKMYGVDIAFDEKAFSTCSMTTSISRGDLYQKIDVICEITGASYAIEDTSIRITGPGCQ